nr:ADP,ATP carrier protein, mitochondrial [Tanacetum cinerariifolium]
MTADRSLPSVSQKLHLLGSTMTQGVQQPQPYQKSFTYVSYSTAAFRYLTQQSTHLSMIVPKVSPVCIQALAESSYSFNHQDTGIGLHLPRNWQMA